jgi:hypothetical protein
MKYFPYSCRLSLNLLSVLQQPGDGAVLLEDLS